MCPDKNLLSAYFDGELDKPFSSQVEAHVAECDSCSRILEEFRALSEHLCQERLPEIQKTKQESWLHLQRRFSSLYPVPVWRRRFQIPAPVLAATAILVILLGVGLLFAVHTPRGSSTFDTVTETRFKVAEYATFEEIIRHLDARGDGQTFIFTLPQDTKVRYWSEPTLIRAADYKRGVD